MRADMKIRELRDAQAVEPERQIAHECIDVSHDEPARADVSDCEHAGDNCEHRAGEPSANDERQAERRAGEHADHAGSGDQRQQHIRIEKRPNNEESKGSARVKRPTAPSNEDEERQHAVERERDDAERRAGERSGGEHGQRSPRGDEVTGGAQRNGARVQSAAWMRLWRRHFEIYRPREALPSLRRDDVQTRLTGTEVV